MRLSLSPLLLTLLFTLSIATTGFAESIDGPAAPQKVENISYVLMDPLYINVPNAPACDASTDAASQLATSMTEGCVAEAPEVVAEYAFPTEVLVVDAR